MPVRRIPSLTLGAGTAVKPRASARGFVEQAFRLCGTDALGVCLRANSQSAHRQDAILPHSLQSRWILASCTFCACCRMGFWRACSGELQFAVWSPQTPMQTARLECCLRRRFWQGSSVAHRAPPRTTTANPATPCAGRGPLCLNPAPSKVFTPFADIQGGGYRPWVPCKS